MNSGNIFGSLRLEIGDFLPGSSTPPTCPGAHRSPAPWRIRSGTGPHAVHAAVRLAAQRPAVLLLHGAGRRLRSPRSRADRRRVADLARPLRRPARTGNANCNANPPTVGAGSQTDRPASSPSTTATDDPQRGARRRHDGRGRLDRARLRHRHRPAGQPVPTGNVTIDWFLNSHCTGAPASDFGRPSAARRERHGSTRPGSRSPAARRGAVRAFLAHYAGDGTYLPSDGVCEPLRVVDANIQITPNGVNRVGRPHTFTAHVNVNDGTGSVERARRHRRSASASTAARRR